MQISIDFALFFDAFIGYKRKFVETFFEKSAKKCGNLRFLR